MVERSQTGREGADNTGVGKSMAASDLNDWFIREVLPLEAALMQFLRRCVRDGRDAADLRQDTYVRVYESAQRKIPHPLKPFLIATARNLVIDRVRREQVVSIETVADLAELEMAEDAPGPERSAMARQDLRRLQAALDRLAPRCREAVVLRKVEGLSAREIAARMGIAEATVNEYLALGMFTLANFVHGDVPNAGSGT
ncbi:MAG TPA: RNA polymerase sigma factor [Rhizomicrobium sp.]